MAQISRTAIYSLVSVLALVGVIYLNQAPEKAAAATTPPAKKSAITKSSEFSEVDYRPPTFPKPKATSRNTFLALVTVDKQAAPEPTGPKDNYVIPAKVANGDTNWAFKGFAIVNGVTMAYLENVSNHQGAYVKQGDAWKTGRVQRITADTVVVSDSDGHQETVQRYNPEAEAKIKKASPTGNEPPPNAAAATQPLTPQLTGPIDPSVTVTPNRPRIRRGIPQ